MKLNWTLTKKLTVGFISVLVVSVISVIVCLYIISRSNSIDKRISSVTIPTVILFKDLNTFSAEFKRLNNSHINTPNSSDKMALKSIIEKDWLVLKQRAKDLYATSNDALLIQKLNEVVSTLEKMVLQSNQITKLLVSEEDYADSKKLDAALSIFEKEFTPAGKQLSTQLENNLRFYSESLSNTQHLKERGTTTLYISICIFMGMLILAGFIGFRFIKTDVLNRLSNFKEIISTLSLGEITEIDKSEQKDEIGDMQNSIRELINGIKANTDFAVEIGKGNYDVDYKALSEKDHLGNALIEMRQNLNRNVEEEKKRTWATQGIAQFSDMLRQDYTDLEEMSDKLLNFLVSYSNSNYGCIFLVEKDDMQITILSMKACYAYERKKYINKRVEIGEGLVGQCYLEKEHIYMTEIPENYVKITSGLGKALPSAILIIPIKFNDEVLGILELASFQVYEKHQLDLLLQLSENFASSLSNLTMNIKTRQLLDELKQQSNVLREQEEEMRQNMEELSATQEEMERKTIDLEETLTQQIKTIDTLTTELTTCKSLVENLKNG
jgi:HAMP domain-containing protein